MGGELIAAIIDRAPHLRDENVNLILGPNSRQAVLRKFLAAEGFEIKCESYSADSGKCYVTFLVTYTGNRTILDDAEAEIGAKNAKYVNKSAQISYLNAKLAAFTKQRDGKMRGGDSAEYEKLMVEKITEQLEKLRAE
jgi:tRNA A22 N-methylase